MSDNGDELNVIIAQIAKPAMRALSERGVIGVMIFAKEGTHGVREALTNGTNETAKNLAKGLLEQLELADDSARSGRSREFG